MNESYKNLQLLKKKWLISAIKVKVTDIEFSVLSFSEYFDLNAPDRRETAHGKVINRDCWKYLIETNSIPNSNTLARIFTKLPELKPYYFHAFWEAIHPKDLNSYELLKIICQLPYNVRSKAGIDIIQLRSKTSVFKFPSPKKVNDIAQILNLDAVTALICLMRHELKNFPFPDASVFHILEEITFNCSSVVLEDELFNQVKTDIFNFIDKYISDEDFYCLFRDISLWKL